MDHHCPWVNNCIGFYNKKFFVQLLFYFLLTSFSFCITYIPYSYNIIKMMIETYGKGNLKFIYKHFIILLNNLILLGFTVIDFNFFKFHIKLIASNLTTIETLDNELMQSKKYDIGFVNNFKQIFGDNKLLWFLPINLPIGYPNGDGLTWPTKNDMISLDNISLTTDNNNNNNTNSNNIEATLDNHINDGNNNKNNSLNTKIGQSRSSTAADFFLNNKGHYGNYSKYNSVKRNSGNFNSNSTGYDSNSCKNNSNRNKNSELSSK